MSELKFDGEPARPFRAVGEFWYVGWDIPNQWAVDADGQPWMQMGAHGGRVYMCDADELLSASRDTGNSQDVSVVAKALGVRGPSETSAKSTYVWFGIWHPDDEEWIMFTTTSNDAYDMIADRPHLVMREVDLMMPPPPGLPAENDGRDGRSDG